MAKKKSKNPGISNRRARHDYALGDSLIVGIALTGKETKSLRQGHGQLRGSYVNVKNGELWLINAAITGNRAIPIAEDEQTRSRKLLAKRKEIAELEGQKQQGMTIVPLEFLISGRFIKLRIAPGRGKKHYDKRQAIKLRDTDRLNKAELKNR